MINVLKEIRFIFSKKQKLQFILVLIVILIGAMFELLGVSAILPFITLVLTPELIMGNEIVQKLCGFLGITDVKDVITLFGLGLILVYIIKNSYLIFSRYVELKFATKLRRELSTKILKSYLSREYSFHLEHNSSILLRGVTSDVGGTYIIVGELFRIIAEVLTMIGICIFLFTQEPFIALAVMATTLICILWFLLSFRSKIKKIGIENNVSVAKVSKFSLQSLAGIKDILGMQRKEFFIKNFKAAVLENSETARKYNIISGLPNRIFETVSVAGIIGSMCIMNIMGVNLAEMIPLIAVFALAAFRLLPAAGRLSVSMNTIMFQRPSLSNTYYNMREIVKQEILDSKELKTERKEVEKEARAQLIKGIKLTNISWKYSEEGGDVLKKLSITIPKGKSIALIGESGAGKTTLADIMLGLLKPQEGTVYVDEIDIFKNKKTWANMVGYVPQVVFLTDDTIRNNIAFGIDVDKIEDEKIWRALEQAQLADFVKGLKQGIETFVGERGVRFSGGQRQRVAIARALYHDPDVLVLDEATSALDNETEAAVIESIDSLQGVKTMIIVAHRLSTIANCDEIYEITNGVAIKKDKKEVLG